MFDLYYAEGTACLAPQVVLERLALPYRLIEIDITKGMHRTPDFLAVNPAGKVPALRLPDGRIMTEAAAICLHLADMTPEGALSPATGHPDRPLFLSGLTFLATAVQPLYKRFYYPERLTTDRRAAAGIRALAVRELEDAWSLVETHLAAHGPFHLGDRPSIVDIYMMMLITWFDPMEELLASRPAIDRCYRHVADWPAARTCLARQGRISIGTG
ncbi:glutathione S-transferase family protein [Marivibrio halodurans]|uniref:Glutathione S-transferase family protein n=1 Tax=Marivibrio halodurans TaxID=2039722 RepID=A0A8J7S002_9PROT|nr:glutathione S-transferase family protein [Marivibrio halodurans]MBP5857380.1 glutathione S-transferase family protein [Marivibrio halodurans]